MSIKNIKLIDIPKIKDIRGNLSVIEKDILPYPIKRVYYLYDVPSGSYRGGHAHKEQFEFLIALSGSFNVSLSDVDGNKTSITLNKPDEGLLIPNMIWRELDNFSSGSVCLVIASDLFSEDDYIRDLKSFK
ncbi:MAG: WxcM-like domain-containing protein [Winogradskyella sp.]|uniref:sugar 3,4-ketoisomerase n=1 Tax=Winogradskyella sp. TaxID=1883156 RepID=UPI001801F669|nr:FdtA/QdtA family cupin domain-containing protein [Winogradskyella sp.]MBT8245462.1 FdtA/QdtA family cupin domain-containing protein [Winogradskyella sp.]NNK22309.1 WxcM-like domain-containing protein [Winogradskyella sp.]